MFKKACERCMWLRRLVKWEASHIQRTSHDTIYVQLPGLKTKKIQKIMFRWDSNPEPYRCLSNIIPHALSRHLYITFGLFRHLQGVITCRRTREELASFNTKPKIQVTSDARTPGPGYLNLWILGMKPIVYGHEHRRGPKVNVGRHWVQTKAW